MFLPYKMLRGVISRALSSCHIPHVYDSVIKFLEGLSTDKSAIKFCILSTGCLLLPKIPGPSRYGLEFGGRVGRTEKPPCPATKCCSVDDGRLFSNVQCPEIPLISGPWWIEADHQRQFSNKRTLCSKFLRQVTGDN